MACFCAYNYAISTPLSQDSIKTSSKCFLKTLARPFPFHCVIPKSLATSRTFSTPANTSFTWDDVFRFLGSEENFSLDFSPFFDKITACNHNSDKQSEFLPFVMEDLIVGFVHKCFADILRSYQDVFVFPQVGTLDGISSGYVTLDAALRTPEERTIAVQNVIRSLGEDVIPGIRNELYPITSTFGAKEFFSLERAAAPYFGVKAYGVYIHGYVERNGEEFLWVGKRSQEKATFPGMLDHLVGGGLPHGIACSENLIKECLEEAGIPRSVAKRAKAAGGISYSHINGYRYTRDVLFCYDLKLPEDFVPYNQDGEVESFKLIPISHVMNVVKHAHFFKPDCCLAIIDFLIRHGYITPDDPGYLKLLQGVRSGD